MSQPKLRRTLASVMVALTAVLTLTTATPAGATETGSPRPDGHGRHLRGYVAMGDSYSSGEGTGVYTADTDTATNGCHRSPLAYGPQLRDSQRRLRPLTFVACSGAVTRDLYTANHKYPTEPPQLDALTGRTAAVSLTIGGNDIGFAQVLGGCVRVQTGGFGCSADPTLNAVVTGGLAALAGRGGTPTTVALTTILADIHARAPRAHVYLAGYPELFGEKARYYTADPSAPSGYSCVVNADVLARVDYADAQWVLRNTRELNRVIRSAVRQARRSGVPASYVSPSTFDGHGLCDKRRPWINPVLLTGTLTVRSETFHPTPAGQLAYARAFRRAGL